MLGVNPTRVLGRVRRRRRVTVAMSPRVRRTLATHRPDIALRVLRPHHALAGVVMPEMPLRAQRDRIAAAPAPSAASLNGARVLLTQLAVVIAVISHATSLSPPAL